MYEYYDKRVYELKDHDSKDYDSSLKKIREWDYNSDSPIALGLFYKKEAPTFEERFLSPKREAIDRDLKIREILQEAI